MMYDDIGLGYRDIGTPWLQDRQSRCLPRVVYVIFNSFASVPLSTDIHSSTQYTYMQTASITMPNLAALILITVFLTQAVSWIGKSVLQSTAFNIYSRIFLSSKSKQQRILRKQVLKDKAELARTSSQDEFAKWARLRRKVDKSLADLEKISTFTRHRAKLDFRVRFVKGIDE